jgi:hypothetical protein
MIMPVDTLLTPHRSCCSPSSGKYWPIHHLFSKLKESLAGKTFLDDGEVQDAVMTWLREQAGDFYDTGIKKLIPWLSKCNAIHDDCVVK